MGNTNNKESWQAGKPVDSLAIEQKVGKVPAAERMMTAEQLSRYLGVSRQRVYTLTHMREIPHLKIGRTVRFDRHEIDEWLSAQAVPVAKAIQP